MAINNDGKSAPSSSFFPDFFECKRVYDTLQEVFYSALQSVSRAFYFLGAYTGFFFFRMINPFFPTLGPQLETFVVRVVNATQQIQGQWEREDSKRENTHLKLALYNEQFEYKALREKYLSLKGKYDSLKKQSSESPSASQPVNSPPHPHLEPFELPSKGGGLSFLFQRLQGLQSRLQQTMAQPLNETSRSIALECNEIGREFALAFTEMSRTSPEVTVAKEASSPKTFWNTFWV